jgi:hypothetical protein
MIGREKRWKSRRRELRLPFGGASSVSIFINQIGEAMKLRLVLLLFLVEIWVVADCRISRAADVFNPQNGHYYRLLQFPELRWEEAGGGGD